MEKRSIRLVKIIMILTVLAQILRLNFCKILQGSILTSQTGITITINKEYLNFILKFLKNSNFFSMKSLVDIFGVDYLGRSSNFRFLVYYVLYSKKYGISLTIKVYLDVYDILISSTNLYGSAGWLEREVYDMFGIFFYKNEDMRRILSDYGFEGFPLRKDFPLTGFFELQYSEEEKVIISAPTKVGQALRLFHFSSVWDLVKKN